MTQAEKYMVYKTSDTNKFFKWVDVSTGSNPEDYQLSEFKVSRFIDGDLIHPRDHYTNGWASRGASNDLKTSDGLNLQHSDGRFKDDETGRAIALTDYPGTSRVLISRRLHGGKTYDFIDVRGTELLFSMESPQLFREPMTLCQPGLPAGSNLAAGPDNYFSRAPMGGLIEDENRNGWVGFSLGEVPGQVIVSSKAYSMSRQLYFDTKFGKMRDWDAPVPREDLHLNMLGNAWDANSDLSEVNHPTQLPATHYRFRHFQVPLNAARISATSFTIRVQYKDPNTGKWITFDERFVRYTQSDWGSTHANEVPVLGQKQINPLPLSGTQVPWTQTSTPLAASTPVITSYDPRSPRFAHPVRFSSNAASTIRGTNARARHMLNPPQSDPWDPGLFPVNNPGVGPHNLIDRPGTSVIDLSTSGSTSPQTLTPQGMVPARFHGWFLNNNNGLTYKEAYDYALGINYGGLAQPAKYPAGVSDFYNPQPQWWVTGTDTANPTNKSLVLQLPPVNAYDYGWYPRAYNPRPAGYYNGSGALAGSAPGADSNVTGFWQWSTGSAYADSLRIGDFSENIQPGPRVSGDAFIEYRQAYADPDDVVRRASGALARVGGYSGTDVEGLPLGQSSSNKGSNRPIMLNRPFQSVAEMGAAFRGSPWKHLDFFLPESADASLLDVFCLSEPPPVSGAAATLSSGGTYTNSPAPPLLAGKVNLNTRQEPVLRAMLAGVLKNQTGNSEVISAGSASDEAAKVAQALIDRTTGIKLWQGPLTNVSELVGKLFAKDLTTPVAATDPVYTSTVYQTRSAPNRNPDVETGRTLVNWHFTGFTADLDAAFSASKDKKNKRFRESVLRALSDGGQTRVWNLMVDMIVQTGRLPPIASKLADFVIEGQNRVWVFLAIDRLTGEILDQQMEWVTE